MRGRTLPIDLTKTASLIYLSSFLFLLLLLQNTSSAQFVPASPPLASLPDKRFEGVKEDWGSPALTGSNLKPARPVVGYVNHHPGYTVELVRVQWRHADPVDLYVMKPDGVQRPPVILYLYSFPEDTDRFTNEAFQKGATNDGFAAVGFVSALTGARYHDRPAREWFISELQESLASSAHDVQMVLDYLASRNDFDMNRVGMFAHGSGASIAIMASAADSRIKVLDTLDPWGDWPVWIAKSPFVPEDERATYVQPEFLQKVAGLDPVDWLPKIQAKAFRLQARFFEANTPRAAEEKLCAAVPKNGTVVIYKTREDLKKMVLAGKELAWIQHELRSVDTSTVADKQK